MTRIPKPAGGKPHPVLPDARQREERTRKPSGRRPYQRPTLIRYGTLAELTENSGQATTADPGSVPPPAD